MTAEAAAEAKAAAGVTVAAAGVAEAVKTEVVG